MQIRRIRETILRPIIIVFVVLNLPTASAIAEEVGISEPTDQIYIRIGAGRVNSQTQAVHYGQIGWALSTTGPLFATSDGLEAGVVHGAIGIMRNPNSNTPIKPFVDRIEISFAFWDHHQRSLIESLPGTTATFNSVDGTRQILFGAGSPYADIRSDFEYQSAGLRIFHEHELTPEFSLLPQFGLVYAHREEYHHFDISTPFSGGTMENPIEVSESLQRHDYGIEAGVGLKIDASDTATIEIGVSIAVLNSNVGLDASDCLGNAVVLGGDCDGSFYQSSVSTSDQIWTTRTTAQLSAQLQFGPGTLSASGFAKWDEDLAGIRNPTPLDPSPASIRYDDGFHYGWLIQYEMPIH